jgi:hypothetical protein
MITKGDIVDIINEKIDTLIKNFKKNKNIKFIFKTSGSFFRKNTLNNNSYVSDIDTNIYIQNDNIDNTTNFVQNGIKYIYNSADFYIVDIKAGFDDRFDFFTMTKNGMSNNYNANIIRESINKLHVKNVINKEEMNEILEYVKDNPNLLEINKFYDYLKKYKNLFWTYDNIQNGKLLYREKIFNFTDIVKNFVIIVPTILEFEKGKYIVFEIGFISYTIKKEYTNLSKYSNSKIISKYSITPLNSKKNLYVEVLKFYIRKQYFKLLKRLKLLLSIETSSKNSGNIYTKKLRDKKNKKNIFDVINTINKLIVNKELRCLSQIKERITIINILLKYKDELEIKRLFINVLKDSIEYCKYDFQKNIINGYNFLQEYNKENIKKILNNYEYDIENKINSIVFPYFVEINMKLSHLLPFNLSLS